MVDPTNAQTLFAATTGGGVFKSTDGASSWFAYNDGLSQSNVYALALNSRCYGTLFAGTGSGVWRNDTRNTLTAAP